MKLKQVFTVLSVSLFCFYGMWLSQGQAEDVSIAKDFGRTPVNNKEVLQAFDTEENYHQTFLPNEGPITFDSEEKKEDWKEWVFYEGHQSSVLKKDASPDLQKPVTASVHNDFTSSATSAQVPIAIEKEIESFLAQESVIELSTLDEKPSPDMVEEKIPASDTAEENELRDIRDIKEKDAPSYVSVPFLAPVNEEKLSSDPGVDGSEDSDEASLLREDTPVIVAGKEVLSDGKESDISPETPTPQIHSSPGDESGIELPTLDESPYPEIVEEKLPASNTNAEGKEFREDSSVNEDNQKIAADRETPPDTSSPLPITDLPTDEEVPFSEEKNRDWIPVTENREQENTFDEEDRYFPEKMDTATRASEPFPASVHEKRALFEFRIDAGVISDETSLLREDTPVIVADKEALSDGKESDSSPETPAPQIHSSPGEESGIGLTTIEVKTSQDTVEEKILSSDTTREVKTILANPSIKENNQKIAAGRETPPDTSLLPITDLSTDEEVPFSEEENRDRIPVAENREQKNTFDVEDRYFPEKMDTAAHVSEPSPVSVHEKRTLSEFGIDDSEISDEASLLREDAPEIVADKEVLSDGKETDISPETPTPQIHSSPGEESGIELPTLDESPYPEIVEEKLPASDTNAEGKEFREDSSVNEDNQKIAAGRETPPDTSPLPITDLSPDEEVPLSEEEDRGRIPVTENREQENTFDVEDRYFPEEIDTATRVSEPFPASVHEKRALSEFGIDESEISGETSPFSKEKQEILTDKDAHLDGKEKTISPATSDSETESFLREESEIELSILNERPSPDIVEEKIPASDTTEGKEFQEDSSVSDDDQKIAADKEASSAASPITFPNLPPDEEASFIEEEKENQTSVTDNKEQENSFDEENTSFLEEDEPPISRQVNADERESEYTKEKDIAPVLPEPFPAPAQEKKTLSAFGSDDSEISGGTYLLSGDKQELDTDKDVQSDGKEKTISPATSASEIESFLAEEGGIELPALDERPFPDIVEEKIPASDTVEGKEFQEDSSVNEDDKKIAADKEASSATSPITLFNLPPDEEEIFVKEDESPIDYQSIGKKKTETQELSEETNEGEDESLFTWKMWHSDPTHNIILAVVIALGAAKIGGWIAGTMRHPKVVGKLIAGMLLGNIYLFLGSDYFGFLKTMPFLKMISYFGTLILLLTAGLHTDLRAIFRVGVSSVLVCLGGMAVPAGLGIIVSNFLLPDISIGSKVLLAIVLCSTSTGLLFAILNELKIMNTIEGRVIVGATILTEIIVILSFGVVSGIVVEGGVSLLGISVSFGVAALFLTTAVILIFKYGEKFGNFLTNRLTEGLNIPIIVILSLLTAFMFGSIGLHTVIGAFIAGLFLRNVKLRSYDDGEHRNVESYIRPFYALLVPILFVRVGAMVELKSFFNLDAVLLGLAITGAAVMGKLFCGLCPIEKGTKRLVIGFGMAMKLEGTLILAGIGRDAGIFNDTVFSSFIMAIVFTSTVCPFLMKTFVLRKKNIRCETIRMYPEKTELVTARVNKRTRLTIFGLSLI
ncbi:MAG: cation:proton antiporter [Candidatus Scalindua sp.]|nr:cation:proton antiporter [Candidatus Scalindua sp.]